MKNTIVTIMLTLALLAILTSCGKTVTQAEYDKVNNELSMATRTINQQTASLNEIIKKNTEAEVYAVVLDLLMYPFFASEGLPTRFKFESQQAWLDTVNSAVAEVKDDTLKGYITKLQVSEVTTFVVMDYLISKIRQNTIINQ